MKTTLSFVSKKATLVIASLALVLSMIAIMADPFQSLAQSYGYGYTYGARGSNLIRVDTCENAPNGVMVRRFGKPNAYLLTNSIRNAGHGMRQYTLTCVSGTMYRVEWIDVIYSTSTSTPAFKAS